VGGDYLDYFENEDGHWVIVIADVCGKGVPAALLMTVLRSTFRVEARGLTSARAILSAVNQAMQINLDNRSFVTAICLVLDRDGKTMSYSRAGHPQLLKMPDGGGTPESIDCAGIALGLTSDHQTFDSLLDEVTIPLEAGDRYLIYTDGLTEATNGEKDSYGMERLEEVVTGARNCDPDGIIQEIMADIRAFTGTAPYHDDLTMLALEVTK
jgi:sigma-B regulation protein RsbU (phosphoserine phosphatase)